MTPNSSSGFGVFVQAGCSGIFAFYNLVGTKFGNHLVQNSVDIFKAVGTADDLGFNIEATSGTGKFLKEHGIRTRIKKKLNQGSTEILDSLRKGHIAYVINTPGTDETINTDGYLIRRVAIENNVPLFTSLYTVGALLNVLDEITMKVGMI